MQLFYVVSGFLISYVLLEARSYETRWSFYENRLLRIVPIYWVVAIATLLLSFAGHAVGTSPPFFDVYQQVGDVGFWALILSNVFILGQDVIMFTGVHDGTYQFSMDYQTSEVVIWHGLLAPQAWTLAVELMFYAIAPFVLGRLRLMLVLLLLSLGLRLVFIQMGFGNDDPWSYRFFPTELALFLIGALSHQLWMPVVERRGLATPFAATAVVGVVLVLCVLYPLSPTRAGMVVVFALALPFLFAFQRRNKWDRWIGDLSYPIYISHFLVMLPMNWVWDKMTGVIGYRGLDETLSVIVLTVGVSILLKWFVADPLERVRDRVRQTPRSTARTAPNI